MAATFSVPVGRAAFARALALGLVLAVGTNASAEPLPGPERAARLAECAAYYFNVANVKAMSDYDAYYSAGERAYNRAARVLGRTEVDRLVADAATAMTAETGGDRRNFVRVEARIGADCDALSGRPPD